MNRTKARKMFGVTFGSTGKSLADTTDLVNLVSSSDYYGAKRLIESKGYTKGELCSVSDTYANNLLHLAVSAQNSPMVTYFLENGISSTKQNKFKQSAWDLAVTLRNNDVMDKFVSHRVKTENTDSHRLTELTGENDALRTKNRELKRLNDGLEITLRNSGSDTSRVNNDLTRVSTELNRTTNELSRVSNELTRTSSELADVNRRYNLRSREVTTLTTENSELRSSNKRLRSDYESVVSQNNDLRVQNSDLAEKNKKLKTSVETLMANSKR